MTDDDGACGIDPYGISASASTEATTSPRPDPRTTPTEGTIFERERMKETASSRRVSMRGELYASVARDRESYRPLQAAIIWLHDPVLPRGEALRPVFGRASRRQPPDREGRIR